jgi:L-ascorbate metabolism protein UlaG (beta-lactamase superfamily)
VLVVNPGTFCDAQLALEGADAIMMAHEHLDHPDAASVNAAQVANPELKVW